MQFTTLIGDLQVTSAARETTFGTEGYHHHHQHQSNNPNHFKATPVSFVYKSKEHVRSLFFNKVLTTKVVCTFYFYRAVVIKDSTIRWGVNASNLSLENTIQLGMIRYLQKINIHSPYLILIFVILYHFSMLMWIVSFWSPLQSYFWSSILFTGATFTSGIWWLTNTTVTILKIPFPTTMMECKNEDAISKDQNQKNTNLACKLPFLPRKEF